MGQLAVAVVGPWLALARVVALVWVQVQLMVQGWPGMALLLPSQVLLLLVVQICVLRAGLVHCLAAVLAGLLGPGAVVRVWGLLRVQQRGSGTATTTVCVRQYTGAQLWLLAVGGVVATARCQMVM